jgi:hypothetical protein
MINIPRFIWFLLTCFLCIFFSETYYDYAEIHYVNIINVGYYEFLTFWLFAKYQMQITKYYKFSIL